jgi:hypothetical protein
MANSHSRMKLLNQYRQRTVPNYAPLVLMNLTANHANPTPLTGSIPGLLTGS